MIIEYLWRNTTHKRGRMVTKTTYPGWFLLGILPLFIRVMNKEFY